MQIPSSLYGPSAGVAALASRNDLIADVDGQGAGFASLLRQQRQAVPAATPSPPPKQSSAPAPAPAPVPGPASAPAPAPVRASAPTPPSSHSNAKKAGAAQAPAPSPPESASPAEAAADEGSTDAAGTPASDGPSKPQNSRDADMRAMLRGKLRAADGSPPAAAGADDKADAASLDEPTTTDKPKRGAAQGNDGHGIDPNLNLPAAVLPAAAPAVATRSGDFGSSQEQLADGGPAASKPATSFAVSASDTNLATAPELDAKRDATAANATTASADPTAAIAGGAFSAVLAEHRAAETTGASRSAANDSAAPVAANASAFGPAPTAGTAAPAAVDLPTPVNAPDFAQQLGAQVSILTKDGVQRAELHLNPPDMGPVSVAITLDGTQARIDFGADVAATRHAIETGMPALASALADAGFTLAGGGVSQHSGGGRGAGQGSAQSARTGGDGRRSASVEATAGAMGSTSSVLRRTVPAGGVDLYA